MRPAEEGHGPLVHLEGPLPIVVLLEQLREVDQHLRRRHLHVHGAVIRSPSKVERAEGLLQVAVQALQLDRLADACLRRALRRVARRVNGPPRDFERLVWLLVAEHHLGPLAPDRRDLVDALEVHLHGLLKDLARIVQVVVLLVKLRESDPEVREAANRLRRVHGHHRLRVALDHLLRVVAEELGPVLPLVHVVRVLPQQDGAQQQRPPLREVLHAREPHVHAQRALGPVVDALLHER